MTESIKSDSPLEKNVFQEDINHKTFQEILDTLDGIQVIFVSRKDFNEKKGNFLEGNGSDNSGIQYLLYLPKGLKVNELPSIIYRVNKLTFGEELPEYASSNELKIKIVLAVDTLLGELKKDEISRKDIKKAIKNYVRLYTQMFGEEEAQQLNKTEYRESVLNSRNIDKYENYEKKLTSIQTLESLGELEEGIEKLVSKEIESHFLESFLERGVDKLRIGMMTITQLEQEDLDFDTDGISQHSDTDKLDEKERLLREKIGIDTFKQELKELRKKGHLEEIEKKEIEATNEIIRILHEYPYQMTEDNYGYQPKEILKRKEIYCVGFSLIGHAFLSELGIKHKGLMIPAHSALEVSIGGKNYYFDATAGDKLIDVVHEEKIGTYSKINPIGGVFREDVLVIPGNIERILLSHIYNNKGNALSRENKNTESIAMYDKAIEFFSDDYTAYYNKGKALYNLGKYEKANAMYNKGLEKNPIDVSSYNNKGLALDSLGKYDEAIATFDKGLEFSPYYLDINFNKGNSLLSTDRPEEAIVMYDKVLSIKPNYRKAINNKGNALYNLGKYEEALELYKQTIKLNDKYIGAFYNAGNCFKHLQKPEKALDMFRKVLKLNPNRINAYINIGNILVSLGRYEEALYTYNTAIKKDSDNPELYYNKGEILDILVRYEEAELVYKQAIELEPKNPNYYLDRGVSLYNLNRFQEAIDMFGKVLELDPNVPLVYTNKAMCLVNLGNYKLAEFYLYVGSILEGNEISFKINYEEEIKEIDVFLEEKDLEGLGVWFKDMEK